MTQTCPRADPPTDHRSLSPPACAWRKTYYLPLCMPPNFNSISKKLNSPNALIADLQSEVMRLRMDNASLRRERDALDIRKAIDVQQAEDIARHLRRLADRADDVAASMRGIQPGIATAATAPAATAPAATAPAAAPPSITAAAADEASVVSSPHTSPLVTSTAPTDVQDVLLQSAARLDSVKARLVPPIRGSYLVELWKRRDGPSWQRPLQRADLPPRAYWSAAELERLACTLSDAYDEFGQPAWGLLARFQKAKAADGGKGGGSSTTSASGAAAAPSAATGAEPAMAGALHVFAGEPLSLDGAGSKAGAAST